MKRIVFAYSLIAAGIFLCVFAPEIARRLSSAPCSACSCKPGAVCQQKCPQPCACRPKPAEPTPAADVGEIIDELDGIRLVRCAQPVPEPKPVILGFSLRVNPVCIRMKRELEKRPDIKKAIAAKYDVRLYDMLRDKDLVAKYDIAAAPACVVLDASGKELKRFSGYKSPAELARWLDVDCPH